MSFHQTGPAAAERETVQRIRTQQVFKSKKFLLLFGSGTILLDSPGFFQILQSQPGKAEAQEHRGRVGRPHPHPPPRALWGPRGDAVPAEEGTRHTPPGGLLHQTRPPTGGPPRKTRLQQRRGHTAHPACSPASCRQTRPLRGPGETGLQQREQGGAQGTPRPAASSTRRGRCPRVPGKPPTVQA